MQAKEVTLSIEEYLSKIIFICREVKQSGASNCVIRDILSKFCLEECYGHSEDTGAAKFVNQAIRFYSKTLNK